MTAAAEKSKQPGAQMSIAQTLIQLTLRGPLHIILIGLALVWLTPTLGLGLTSFRSRGDIASSGWWTTITGQRSSTLVELELSFDADSIGDGINVSAAQSDLLRGATEGVPSAVIGQVDIIEVRGELHVDNIQETLTLPGIGSLTVTESSTADFEPEAQFSGYFIIEDVLAGEAGAIVSYRLTGRQAIDGVIEIDDINDGKRIPRTGTLTVLEDGSFIFERRSSFVGTFEARISPEALNQRPIPVQYSVVQSGGVLQSFASGETADIPLAGEFTVGADGSYSFAPLPDFIGALVSEASLLNPILTVDNYRGVLERPDLPPPGFADNLRNSLIVTIPSTIFPILLASLAAYAFAWMEFPLRDYIYLVVIGLLVIPLQTTWVPVLKFLNMIGINGQFAGIWLTHTSYGLPFSIFLLYSFFRDLPREVFEAARIDGANEGFVFFRIVIPLSMPAIASLAIFQFVWVWNDLMNALIFLDRDKAPLTIGIRNLLGQYGNEWHLLAAGAFVSMIIPLLVFLAFQQYFVRGLTAGAVKG